MPLVYVGELIGWFNFLIPIHMIEWKQQIGCTQAMHSIVVFLALIEKAI